MTMPVAHADVALEIKEALDAAAAHEHPSHPLTAVWSWTGEVVVQHVLRRLPDRWREALPPRRAGFSVYCARRCHFHAREPRGASGSVEAADVAWLEVSDAVAAAEGRTGDWSSRERLRKARCGGTLRRSL